MARDGHVPCGMLFAGSFLSAAASRGVEIRTRADLVVLFPHVQISQFYDFSDSFR